MAADLDLTPGRAAAPAQTLRRLVVFLVGAGALVVLALTGGAAVTLIGCVVAGVGLTYLSGLHLTTEERLAYGTVVGAVAVATADFLLASAFGMGLGAVLAGLAVALAVSVPGWWLARDRLRPEVDEMAERWRRRQPWPLWALLAICWPFTLAVLARTYQLTSQGLVAGGAWSYADWAAHLTYAGSFAYGHNFPPQFPVDPGHRLAYPFMIDLLAASLVPLGTTLTSALVLSSGLLALAFPAVMYLAAVRIIGSRGGAALSVLVFTLSGGLGFLLLFDDVRRSGLGALQQVTTLATQNPDLNYQWLNPVLAWMLPQRSVLFGFSLALLVMAMLWTALGVRPEGRARDPVSRYPGSGGDAEERRERPPGRDRAPQKPTPEMGYAGYPLGGGSKDPSALPAGPPWQGAGTWAPFAFAGVVAGLTPSFHLHAYGTIVALSAFWAVFSPRRQWVAFFVPALALGVPVALWMAGAGAASLHVQPWWLADTGRHHDGPVVFWLKNTSLLVPAMAVAFLWRGVLPAGVALHLAPIWLWFLVPNFIVFQPWDWDNTKFFAYWALFGALPVGALLARLLKSGLGGRLVAYGLAALLMLSGTLDLGRSVVPNGISAQFTDAGGLRVAAWARANTDPGAIFLVAPDHNEPIPTLGGRRVVAGYPGWLWTYGLSDWVTRTEDAKRMLRGDPATLPLLRQYGVDYVVIGPQELGDVSANPAYFDAVATRVYSDDGYTVYRVR